MRAVVINEVSNRDTVRIEQIADPVPDPDQVLVNVQACGINYTDYLSLDGKYQNNPPPPFTPGRDAAGIIAAVGENITRHKVGDRVIAWVCCGVYGGVALDAGRDDSLVQDRCCGVGWRRRWLGRSFHG